MSHCSERKISLHPECVAREEMCGKIRSRVNHPMCKVSSMAAIMIHGTMVMSEGCYSNVGSHPMRYAV